MLRRLIDILAFWLPRCAACRHRKPRFVDGLCFECCVDRMESRFENELLRALDQKFINMLREYRR